MCMTLSLYALQKGNENSPSVKSPKLAINENGTQWWLLKGDSMQTDSLFDHPYLSPFSFSVIITFECLPSYPYLSPFFITFELHLNNCYLCLPLSSLLHMSSCTTTFSSLFLVLCSLPPSSELYLKTKALTLLVHVSAKIRSRKSEYVNASHWIFQTMSDRKSPPPKMDRINWLHPINKSHLNYLNWMTFNNSNLVN